MNISQKLGIRVFNYYLSKKISIGIFFLTVSIIVASSKQAIVLKTNILFSLTTSISLVTYLIYGLFAASLLLILGAIFISWLNYINCCFTLGENAISIKRGILNKKEVSIPYRQIQNIDIEQSISYRIMGVSKLVILTAGNDSNDTIGKSEAVFEIIDYKIAQQIKEDILKRTNPQNTSEVKI